MHINISDKKIQVEKSDTIDQYFKGRVFRVVRQGRNFADATFQEKQTKPHIKKISKTEYINLSTGEIHEYQPTENNEKTTANIRKTFDHLRWTIRHNFESNKQNQLFLTLTYDPKKLDKRKFKNGIMSDSKKLYDDYRKFYQKLKRQFDKHSFEYICVAEPQENGSWHLHIMLKSDQPVLYINNIELTEIWGHGYTDAQRLKSDDIGTYYVSYFTDVIPNELDNEKTSGEEKSKSRKKGERLKFYPKGFKFYRCSRGIKDPSKYSENIKLMTYEKLEQEFVSVNRKLTLILNEN